MYSYDDYLALKSDIRRLETLLKEVADDSYAVHRIEDDLDDLYYELHKVIADVFDFVD